MKGVRFRLVGGRWGNRVGVLGVVEKKVLVGGCFGVDWYFSFVLGRVLGVVYIRVFRFVVVEGFVRGR